MSPGSFPGYTLNFIHTRMCWVKSQGCELHLLHENTLESTAVRPEITLSPLPTLTFYLRWWRAPRCQFLSIVLLLLLSQVLKSIPPVPHLTLHYLSGQAFGPVDTVPASFSEGPVCRNDPQTPESCLRFLLVHHFNRL